MVLNPAGYVPIFDFGAPKIISGRARAAISGGQFVVVSGASAVVSSGANSFDPKTDMLFSVTAVSGLDFTGIALSTVGSNEPLSVAVEGSFIVTSAGTVTAGRTVVSNGGDAVVDGTTAGTVIGRAYATAGSEGYTLVHIGRS